MNDPPPQSRELRIRFVGLGVTAVLAAGVGLSGCSAPSLSMDWFPSLPGFSSAESSQAQGSGPPPAMTVSMEENCPSVDIRAGAGTLAVGAKGGLPANANDVRYQLTFTQIARQCALSGQTVRMRVGVQGRAVVGPSGTPGQMEVPLRYAVVREGPEPRTIATKFRRVAVNLEPGGLNALFTDVEDDLSFPLPPVDELTAYVVYIGFDAIGDRPEPRTSAKKGKAK
jgi:hypothetical protein